MDETVKQILIQMPMVGILLAVFWQLRLDTLAREDRVMKLLENCLGERPVPPVIQPKPSTIDETRG